VVRLPFGFAQGPRSPTKGEWAKRRESEWAIWQLRRSDMFTEERQNPFSPHRCSGFAATGRDTAPEERHVYSQMAPPQYTHTVVQGLRQPDGTQLRRSGIFAAKRNSQMPPHRCSGFAATGRDTAPEERHVYSQMAPPQYTHTVVQGLR
jgi:putative component of membrane protein insertase Oxa1/YidC/SpoIIIJ protein YidD